MTDPQLDVLMEKVRNLEEAVAKSEHGVLTQLRTALDSHQQLHAAHEKAHQDEHAQTQRAVERAEDMTKQIARDHEVAHSREHMMTKEQTDKSDQAMEQQRASMQRENNERFKTITDRLEVLERENAANRGRERGVGLLWGVLVGVIGLAIAIITFVAQWAR